MTFATTPPWEDWSKQLAAHAGPLAVVDLEAWDRNLATLDGWAAQSKAGQWRIASKSVRCRELLERALLRAPHCRGVMTYSASETLFLAKKWKDRPESQFHDFLLAYPTHHPAALRALAEAQDQWGARVSLVTDSVEAVNRIADHYPAKSAPLGILLEIDVAYRPWGWKHLHLGVRRSPLREGPEVVACVQRIQAHSHLQWRGLMAYEAQVAGLGDRNPFKRVLWPVLQAVRLLSVRAVAAQRRRVTAYLHQRGLAPEIFNGAGTGSMNLVAAEEVLTELTGGSGLYCSALFDGYSNMKLIPALFLAAEVVRRPSRLHATVLGGSWVASGEPGWDRVPMPVFPEGARLLASEATGEVQTPLLLQDGTSCQLGSLAWFRPSKAGEPLERFQNLWGMQSGSPPLSLATYRGEQQCFL